MKILDLYKMYAEGKKMPKIIDFAGEKYEWDEWTSRYIASSNRQWELLSEAEILLDEVTEVKINNFALNIYHPDEDKSYYFDDYKEYKKWVNQDGYRFDRNFGGCCEYHCFNEYTAKEVKRSMNRAIRYYENKEIENQRSKVWREQQKLKKMLENESRVIDDIN